MSKSRKHMLDKYFLKPDKTFGKAARFGCDVLENQ